MSTETTAAPVVRSLGARLGAEAFGTYLLVFGIIGAALFSAGIPDVGIGWLGAAFALGLAVVAGAYSVGPISGGHFNPAVSVGLAVAGKFAWKDVLPYVIAQILGGILASTTLLIIASGKPDLLPALQKAGFASNGYDSLSPEGFNLLSVIVVEVVATAIFVGVILGVTSKNAAPGFAGLVIGLTLTLLLLVSVSVSNGSFNPARSISTAIYGGPTALAQLWVFIIFPTLGGIISGIVYRLAHRKA
jgi:aquaporin Z